MAQTHVLRWMHPNDGVSPPPPPPPLVVVRLDVYTLQHDSHLAAVCVLISFDDQRGRRG